MKFLTAFFIASIAFAQTIPNAVPPPSAEAQFLDANGAPLAGGKLYTYAAGTTTPLATYTDSSGMTPNANPIVLDSAGRAQIWIGAQAYKFVLQDANSVVQWTEDNLVDTTLYFVNYVKTAGTATLITYTPVDSGGTQRTVAARLNDTLSVKDFGALCNGSTNDTSAFTAALATNKTILVANGTCVINSLTVPSSATLRIEQ